MRGFNDFNNCYFFAGRLQNINVSVPMRGFNDFNRLFYKEIYDNKKFPSPCGVLMILIYFTSANARELFKFPSPCGVLMILIEKKMTNNEINKFPSPCGVLMILIIYSYLGI